MTATETHARITSLFVQDVFVSSEENELKADVEIVNDSNLAHSAQVVFRGYVRNGSTLIYEFLHEQVWLFIRPSESKIHHVAVEVWLPRFPPSIKLPNGFQVEYSVRATVDPWYQNNHVEKIFIVRRRLVLKMPHIDSYQKRLIINQCVNHGAWYHKECKPINGEIWSEKGIYSFGETVRVSWRLKLYSTLEKVKLSLIQHFAQRNPSPDHPELFTNHERVLCVKETTTGSKEPHHCEIVVPKDLPVTMAMTLWNVLVIKYELLFQVKMKGHKPYVDFRIPIIIASEQVKSRTGTPAVGMELYKRAQDIDDDTDDDDDQDSELGEAPQEHQDFSVDIDTLEIKGEPLSKSYARVGFTVNSKQPEALRSLRLLLQGEVRAGSVWYSFIRYKAHITSGTKSLFGPGQHSLNIQLPFKDSQYDSNILPPSLGEDIRYICRVSTSSWTANNVAEEVLLPVDRMVDTWAKEKFKAPYSEIIGAYGIEMDQRAFQRGKYAFVTVTGKVRRVRVSLEQQRRLRYPALSKDESYCHERIVAALESPEDKDLWPKQWALRIPRNIPPSIEIAYWNVLVLNYALQIKLTLEDGHEHTHMVPIWIGCTDDKLPPPVIPTRIEKREASGRSNHSDNFLPEELPEFEVVETDETLHPPQWVDRFHDHMYY
ncbi:unnamed protein product [Haemonchus placei]|uniref:Arrestin_C domain-containing protein n=1 Tax=Haemonchus placei TaxID=6290 RepID=A0A0N4WSQ4_HAEPC|nr:unnamed protein product [Haemonchus placei]